MLTEDIMFVLAVATNAHMDTFHFDKRFFCKDICVSFTKTNRPSEWAALDVAVGPVGGILYLTQKISSLSQRSNTVQKW